MVSTQNPPPSQTMKHGLREAPTKRVDIPLNKGKVSDALRVFNGPCRIYCMFMEITEAVPNTACNMSWILDSDQGGARVIGDTVDIAAAALGDFFVAELDGTNLVKATTSTGLIYGYWYEESATNGVIVPPGGIDIVLGTNNLTAGKGTLYVYYQPLENNACIVAEDWQTSTTTTTTTTSTTSSTSSTASTTSSTSSTASTTSSTSSTSSTASTTTTTTSTTSTSTTSSTTSSSSTSSTTSSTASTTSSTSSTASTTSTTTTWPPEEPN